MVKGIIGKKIGMTQIFNEQGHLIPVTVVQAGPCPVVDIKTIDRDGYNAIVIGYGSVKNINKPMYGRFKKANCDPKQKLTEIRIDNPEEYDLGQEVTVEIFSEGEKVDVTGVSKGKGFQGTIKRWNFARGPRTHGSRSHRIPGSIGDTGTSRVVKGKKMPGRMGGERVTIQNLEVIGIDLQENTILLKGAVPGPRKTLVTIRNAVKASQGGKSHA